MSGMFVDAMKVWGFGFACGGVVGMLFGVFLMILDEDARAARHRRKMERAKLRGAT